MHSPSLCSLCLLCLCAIECLPSSRAQAWDQVFNETWVTMPSRPQVTHTHDMHLGSLCGWVKMIGKEKRGRQEVNERYTYKKSSTVVYQICIIIGLCTMVSVTSEASIILMNACIHVQKFGGSIFFIIITLIFILQGHSWSTVNSKDIYNVTKDFKLKCFCCFFTF